MPLSPHISPIHNFYGYVNDVWERTVPIPSYAHTIGVSEEIEEVVKQQLTGALQKVQRLHPHKPLGLVAGSMLHAKAQHFSVEYLRSLCAHFVGIKTVDDLGSSIGYLNRVQSHAPLSFVVSSDSNDSKKCMVFLYEPELALPEKHLYTGHRAQDNKARDALRRLLSESQHILGPENCGDLPSTITLEHGLLPYLSKVEDRKDITFYYNPMTYAELTSAFPALPWRAMLIGLLGSKESSVYENARYIVTNERWLHHLQSMLQSVSFAKWGTWMSSQLLTTFVEYMPSPFKDLHYEVYGRILRGSKRPTPTAHVMLKVLQTYAPQSLSRIFVEEMLSPGTKEEATRLVHSLKAATKARIAGLEWMSEETKAHAQKKLDAMRFQVAYPDKWESELERTHLSPEHPLQNILALAETDTKSMIDDLKKNNCGKVEGEWDEGAFEVNAYYYPDGNMMTIPAGILQPPFFDLKRSRAWNLGGIGAAIGHEITHGFDDDGRKYDSEGNFRSWWQPSDSDTFTRMSHEVERLFDGVQTPYGTVNGKHTLSENLADLGGVAIALEALKAELGATEDLKKAYREFFISYAVSWRTKQRPEKAKQALLLDRHAPAYLRVNLIVKQFAEFFEAFPDPHESTKKRIVFW
jgi:putative endopeptidase